MSNPLRIGLLISAALLGTQLVALFFFGQPTICECGFVKVWEGVVQSSGNSQHLSDWYTFSHIIHGFLFYSILWLLFPRMHVGLRLAIAVGVEVAWEVLENTPMVIDHYRQQALAQGYTGDSILNSASDTIAMVFGFVLARISPLLLTLIMILIMEIGVAYAIRDNLALNILNLIHIFPSVAEWQTNG